MDSYVTKLNSILDSKIQVIVGVIITFQIAIAGSIVLANKLIIMFLFALPIAIAIFLKPVWLFLLVLFSGAAKLKFGLPGNANIQQLLQVFFILWAFLYVSINRVKLKKWQLSDLMLIFFIFCIATTIVVRGFGMRALGGNIYGGYTYLILIIIITFYLVAPIIKFKEKHFRWWIYGVFFCSLLPVCVQFLITISKGNFIILVEYFDISANKMMSGLILGDASKTRWSTLRGLSMSILVLSFLLPNQIKYSKLRILVLTVGFALMSLSGFRSQIFGFVVISIILIAIYSDNRIRTLLIIFLTSFFIWIVILLLVPYLPYPVQRAISFIPLVKERIADEILLKNAQLSIDWRIEIWKYCLTNLHQYLLIGRGLTTDTSNFPISDLFFFVSPKYYYLMHSYHNGFFSLLVDFGVFGLISVSFFFLFLVQEGKLSLSETKDKNSWLYRLFLVTYVILIYKIISFFLIFGSLETTFPDILNYAILLKLLISNFKLA